MKHLTLRLYLVATLAALFFGCSNEDPVSPQSKIGRPTNVVLQKLSATSFSVSWVRADSDDGTDTITIIRTAPTTAQWRVAVASPTSVQTIHDSTILRGGSFTVTVSSKDSTSAPATITIVNELGKPTNVVLTPVSKSSFDISWVRAFNDIGTDTVIVNRTQPTSGQWKLTAAAPTSTVTFEDPIFAGGSYSVRVASEDSISNPVTITLNAGVPAPTGLAVTSISSTQIAVRWTRNAAEQGVDTIIAKDASTGAIVVAKPVILATSAWLLTGLSPNVKYLISVTSSSGNSSPALEWATATRSGILTLFETATPNDATHHSGLVLGPVAHTAAIDGTEQSFVDLVLATDNVISLPFLSLQGANVAGSGIPSGRATLIGNNAFVLEAGLDGDFYTENFTNEFTLGYNSQPIPGTTSDPFIILVRTADNHYARVQIVPQANGFLWKDVTVGGSTYRALDVIVSYQPIQNAAYASRPGQIRRGTNERKVSAPKATRKK